ncbi:MAG: hypothetical protein ACXVPQ_08625 [Bacteroidia bacterium]
MEKTAQKKPATPGTEETKIMHDASGSSNKALPEVSNYVSAGVAIQDFGFGNHEQVTGYPAWPPKPTAAASELGGGAMVFADRVTDEIHAATLIREKTAPSEDEKTEARNNLIQQMKSEKQMSMGWYWVDQETAQRAVIEKYNYWMVKTSYVIVYNAKNKTLIDSIKAVKEVVYLGYGLEATEPGNNNVQLGTWNNSDKELMNVDHTRTFATNDLTYEKSVLNWTWPIDELTEKRSGGADYSKAIFKEGSGFVNHAINYQFTTGHSMVGEVFLSEMEPIIREHEENVKKGLGANDDTKTNVSLVLGWASNIVSLIPVYGPLAEAVVFWSGQALGVFSTAVGLSVEDYNLIDQSRDNAVKKATLKANKSSMGVGKYSYIGDNVYPK